MTKKNKQNVETYILKIKIFEAVEKKDLINIRHFDEAVGYRKSFSEIQYHHYN